MKSRKTGNFLSKFFKGFSMKKKRSQSRSRRNRRTRRNKRGG